MRDIRTYFSFIISYICMIIPAIIVGSWLVNSLTKEYSKEIIQNMNVKMEQIEEEIESKFEKYYENAIKISTLNEFRPHMFNKNIVSTIDAINHIGSLKMMDLTVKDIILCYGDRIYTAEGYSGKQTYLKKMLEMDEHSLLVAQSALESEEVACVYLSAKENRYYLLHVPVMQSIDEAGILQLNSINYLINREEIDELLGLALGIETHLVEISLVNDFQNDKVYMQKNEQSEFIELNAEEYSTLLNSNDYAKSALNINDWGISISVFYDENMITGRIEHWKQVNILFVVILSLVAGLISYGLGRFQYERVFNIKNSIQNILGTEIEMDKTQYCNDYDFIHFMVNEIAQKISSINDRAIKEKCRIQEQAAVLLFYGGVRNEEVTRSFLESCGVKLEKKYYTIGCVIGLEAAGIAPEVLTLLKDGRISHFLKLNDREACFFLLEMSGKDYDRKYRKRFAESVLERPDGRVQIAFSRVYDNITQVSNAYVEAMAVGKQLMNRTRLTVSYADKGVSENDLMFRFPEEDLRKLEVAVQEKKYTKAKEVLKDLLAFSTKTSFSVENKIYLRIGLLQSVLLNSESVDKQVMNKIVNVLAIMNLEDESNFKNNIYFILEQCCHTDEALDNNKHVDFEAVIQYVENNYMRCDLSLDEVAEYAGMSKSYLSRLFQKETGMKYIDYIVQCRMDLAMKLIKETQMTITDISTTVGYNSIRGFRNAFKAYYGLNASEAREKLDTTK